MQTPLMFVDLKSLGFTSGSQKIAIKMPERMNGLNVDEYSGFSDIINALMSIAPGQLQDSLDQIEWVPVQGESNGFAPLIDLSAANENISGVAQMLIGEMAPGKFLKQNSVPTTTTDQPILADKNIGLLQLTSASPSIDAMPQDNIVPAKKELLGDLKPAFNTIKQNGIDLSEKQTLDGKILQTPSEAMDLKAAINDQTIKKENGLAVKAVQLQGVPPQDVPIDKKNPLTAMRVVEGTANKETIHSDLLKSRGVTTRNDLNVKTPAASVMANPTGENIDIDAESNLLTEIKDRMRSDTSQQNFKPAFGEGSSDASHNGDDPVAGGRQDHRELFQQVLTRSRTTPVKAMESVHGNREPATQTPDMQTQVIRQIVQRMTLHTQGTQSTMTLKLKPEFLGNVHMQIVTDNHQVAVRMATESMAVKEMVEQGLQYLKSELQQYGLEIDKFEVFVANDKDDAHPGQDLAGFRQALKQRKNAMEKESSGNGDDDEKEITSNASNHDRVTGGSNEIDYFV